MTERKTFIKVRKSSFFLRQVFSLFLVTVLLNLCLSCDGMFDFIYDEKTSNEAQTGFHTTKTSLGQLYIDSRDYYVWTYVNFHTETIDSFRINLNLADPLSEEPTDWDIALHAYDARTNNGTVMATDYTDIFQVTSLNNLPEGTFLADVWDSIMVDLSQRTSGIIEYLPCYVNTILSEWMILDLSIIPPTYTLSGKVYIVRFSDDTYCALRLTDYMSSTGVKGYLTIDYVYPLDF